MRPTKAPVESAKYVIRLATGSRGFRFAVTLFRRPFRTKVVQTDRAQIVAIDYNYLPVLVITRLNSSNRSSRKIAELNGSS